MREYALSARRLSKSALHIEEHAQFIAAHQAAMAEFDGKLNALIDIVGRMQGGIESRS